MRVNETAAPVLAVCGLSGAGKTTLLEAAIAKLVARGLAVAVVKHDAHGFVVDREGKDSDRLFRAGATVMLRGPGEQFERRGASAELSLEASLARLSEDHDLLLVEGHKQTPLPKLWLESDGETGAPEGVTGVIRKLTWNSDRLTELLALIDEWLPAEWTKRPLYGGLLVGGMSSRMGEAKQMLEFGGCMLGQIAADALSRAVGEDRVVALGTGKLPDALHEVKRIADAPGLSGPTAALIAAHRWNPAVAWVVSACDHPWIRGEHVQWLLSQRRPGRWAVIPKQRDGYASTMLALYEPQALEALERLTRVEDNASPRALLKMEKCYSPEIPEELADGWKNVNTREEFDAEEARLKTHRGEDRQ